ncbi:hypothetical protein ESZ50_01245 [Weissella muntiaci]|uniref:Uncharacterized protein n=1 Tax=Weissella muntiaci TaxID=2508881 RepID=A0A6C2C9T7_9LACO|nr:hypothetical protein [Weissella muntiaci]TYC50870.1 hypothetical protein ESZ50_01245 [Weissella muntiaci]
MKLVTMRVDFNIDGLKSYVEFEIKTNLSNGDLLTGEWWEDWDVDQKFTKNSHDLRYDEGQDAFLITYDGDNIEIDPDEFGDEVDAISIVKEEMV